MGERGCLCVGVVLAFLFRRGGGTGDLLMLGSFLSAGVSGVPTAGAVSLVRCVGGEGGG